MGGDAGKDSGSNLFSAGKTDIIKGGDPLRKSGLLLFLAIILLLAEYIYGQFCTASD